MNLIIIILVATITIIIQHSTNVNASMPRQFSPPNSKTKGCTVALPYATYHSYSGQFFPNCDKEYYDNVEVFDSIKDVERHIIMNSYNENWVIGGADIYNEVLTKSTVKSLLITEIQKKYDVDTYFPQTEKINKDYDQVWNSMCVNDKGIKFHVNLLWNKKFPLESKFLRNKIDIINSITSTFTKTMILLKTCNF